MNEPVVVGFDDTEHSARAIEYAVGEATVRKVPLRLVHAYRWIPAPVGQGMPIGGAWMESVRQATTVVLDEAVQKVRDAHPGLEVAAVPMQGDPPRMLADASRGASLLVVGGRGAGGFIGLTLGSVALRVLGMAECPVMVVRGDRAPDTGRVMVGIDAGSPDSSRDVLEFAFAEAALREAEVYAIHVWEDPSRMAGLGRTSAVAHDVFAAFEDSRKERLDAVLEPWRQKYPGVAVSRQVFPGTPSRMLVDSTRLADTLVISGRIRTEDHPGMQIGALAHTVLHHAHCPVVVVPEH